MVLNSKKMINAKELRIGNLIGFGEKYFQVHEIQEKCFYVLGEKGIELKNTVAELKPIQLTEEWLQKLGFKQNKFDKVFEVENCQIEIYFFDNDIKCTVCVDSVINKKIEYVHQLQNLYFALTGSELTVA